MFDVSNEDMVEGRLTRTLLLLAAPLVAQNFVAVAQQVVDVFFVGRVGEDAVAGVGLVVPLTALSLVPAMLAITGTHVLTSQRLGAGDDEGARRVVWAGVVLSIALQIVVAVVALLFADTLVSLLGADGAVADYAAIYLQVYAVGTLAAGASDVLEMGLLASGDSTAALYINLASFGSNLVLDPFLILGWGPIPRLEVFGAALATALGFVFGLLIAVSVTFRGTRNFSLSPGSFTFDTDVAREMVSVGWPAAGQRTARHAARVAVIAVVSFTAGSAGLAAYTVGARISTVAFVPAIGLGNAATSVVGQNLGAENTDRARRTTWVAVAVAVIGLSAFAAIQLAIPETIATVFAPTLTAEGLALTADYLVILAFGYWALGAIYTVESGFNGAGKTDVSMYATMLQYWAVRVPVATVGSGILGVGLGYGVHAVFWAVTLSNVAAAVGLCVYFWYSTTDGMLRRAADSASAD
ncbi:MATE family efflux transporter [Salarchaeum sp. JOR-1]|uniref:MATE family efflux transporter n=1 Tax=Salarchaeum sp. JOR-1 TaxID=2599399 RepID=UPI0011982BFE|nr:MATE family efflux transporter [Salarchaeum sp. JOR-1]QDX40087.1 MATE family efflux transporter [Salarchaeum sp. JOR-1]